MTSEVPAPQHCEPQHFERHIAIESAGKTVIDHLQVNTSLSNGRLKKALGNGAVWLQSKSGINRVRRARKLLQPGDVLHLYYDERIQDQLPADAILIADESDYSIWDKPYGMYSQGTRWGDQCTINRFAERQLQPQRPAFTVHRLDRAASGLIILAHSKSMAKTFSAMFERREIRKCYHATVEGRLLYDSLPLTIAEPIDGKRAVTHITAAEHRAESTLLTIEIESGRKHQIRKHLSAAGHPIIGDRLYGSASYEEDLQLRAFHLGFTCPVSRIDREFHIS